MISRTSSIPIFTNIARENFQEFVSLNSNADNIRTNSSSENSEDELLDLEARLMLFEDKIGKTAIITVVFVAMAIEAYIYDYAARHLSDDFVKNYIDKLDLVSKWVIIPRLITGNELPRNHQWFGLLKDLVKQRNSIVHHKSHEIPVAFAEAQKYFVKIQHERDNEFKEIKNAMQLLDLLIAEMISLDLEEAPWIEICLGKK